MEIRPVQTNPVSDYRFGAKPHYKRRLSRRLALQTIIHPDNEFDRLVRLCTDLALYHVFTPHLPQFLILPFCLTRFFLFNHLPYFWQPAGSCVSNMAFASHPMPQLPTFQIWSIEPAALQRVPSYPLQDTRPHHQEIPPQEDVDYITPEEEKELQELDRRARVRVERWIDALPTHPSMFDTRVTQEMLLEKTRKRSRATFEQSQRDSRVRDQQTQAYTYNAFTFGATPQTPSPAKKIKAVPLAEQAVMIDLTSDDATQETRTDDQVQTPPSYQEAGILSALPTMPILHDDYMPSKLVEPSIDEIHFMSLLNDEIWTGE